MSANSGPDYELLVGSAALPLFTVEGWPGGIHHSKHKGTGRKEKSVIRYRTRAVLRFANHGTPMGGCWLLICRQGETTDG